MPESRLERNSASVSLSGVTVETTPPVEGALAISVQTTTSNVNVAANARRVVIRNLGLVQDGDVETIATVNGGELEPYDQIEFIAQLDGPNNELLLLPALAIVTNGARIRVTEQR